MAASRWPSVTLMYRIVVAMSERPISSWMTGNGTPRPAHVVPNDCRSECQGIVRPVSLTGTSTPARDRRRGPDRFENFEEWESEREVVRT